MPPAHDPIEHEPFGQHGVRQMVRPLFIGCCALGVAVSMAMVIRSYSYFDLLWKQENFKRTEISSAIGRLTVTSRTSFRNPQNAGWVYESAEVGHLDDGWQPSIWKTFGVDWGEETRTTFTGRVITVHWFRLQWRTLLVLYLTPVLLDALAKRVAARRARRHHEAEELTPAAR